MRDTAALGLLPILLVGFGSGTAARAHNVLTFTPVDAAYSSSLGRIVLISANPNQLHIHNPTANTTTVVALSAAPLSLSISPDGAFAAVGHSNLISYVNLSTATVQKTLTVTINVTALVLTADYVYIPPTMSVRISDGAITGALTPPAVPIEASLGPDNAIYYSNPSGIQRRSISGGATVGAETTSTENDASCPPSPFAVARRPVFLDGRVYACATGWQTGSLTFGTILRGGGGTYRHLASHPSRGLAAVTASIAVGDTVVQDDTQVHLFQSSFPPQLSGRMLLPQRARWVFFNAAGDTLYVITFNGGISGPETDFGIVLVPLPPAPGAAACAASIAPNSARMYDPAASNALSLSANAITVPAAGGYLTVDVQSGGFCLYAISSGAEWLAPRSETTSGGVNRTQAILVRPNTGSASRTGTVTFGATTLTVTQPAAGSPATTSIPLSFRALRAEYSKAFNKLILASEFPNEVHVFDPVTQSDVIFALRFAPQDLVLSPDGNVVGVGGSGVVTFIDLRTNTATPVYQTNFTAPLLLLTGDRYAHFAAETLPSIDIQTGAMAAGAAARRRIGTSQPGGLAPPDSRYSYVSVNGAALSKWDFATPGSALSLGTPGGVQQTPPCPSFWFWSDGTRLLDCRSGVYRISGTLSADLAEDGLLAGPGRQVFWAANASPLKTTAVILNSESPVLPLTAELHLFGDEGFTDLGKASLPASPNNAHFTAWNTGLDRLYTLIRMVGGLANDGNFPSLVHVTAAANNCATPGSGSASFGVAGGAGQVAVTASCAWKAASNASWLTISSGGFGVGSSTLRYSVARNDTASARSGIISFGNQSFTISQSASVALSLLPTSASVGAAGGSGTVAVTAPGAWTAVSNAAWIQVTQGASGTGNGTVGYTVSANASTVARTGTITIGGATFTINQAGAAAVNPIQLNPASVTAMPGGGQHSISITTALAWTASANAAWISIVSPSGGAGSGNGTLVFAVGPNPGSAVRTGSVTINGVSLTVTQQGGLFSITPSAINAGASAGSGTVTVTRLSGAAAANWSASSNASWLTVSGAGAGDGTFQYSHAANTATSARTAIIDIGNGYTVSVTQAGQAPQPPITSGLHFVPVTPCRVADTRESTRPAGFGPPALAGGVARNFAIADGPCGIPADAKAYSLNVTVVPKGPLGYITIWPAGQLQPLASTLNSVDGRVKANAAIVPAGVNRAVSVLATDATELVLDINGYFIEPALNPSGLAFYSIHPCRIADTREPAGQFGGPIIPAGGSRAFPVRSSNCGIPATARAYSMNATVVPSGPLGYITMWPTGQPQPLVSTLNAPTGAIVANAALVPAGTNGEVSVFAQGQTHVVLDINGYFAPPGGVDAQKFYPVLPCRLVDTREVANAPILGPSELRNHALASKCGLPANARAYSLNATVVPPTILGYMTLWATGQSQPLVSTLNVTDDRIVANAAIVPAGTGGAISSYVTNGTHLILDTNGYFAQ